MWKHFLTSLFLYQFVNHKTLAAFNGFHFPFNHLHGHLIFQNNKPTSLQYSSYQTTPYCTPSEPIESPTDIQSIQRVVIRALLLGKTVKAFGSRHSITDVICTEGIPLSMEKFKTKVLNADFSVTLGAGVKMGEALEFLEQRGRTFIHVPGFSKLFIHFKGQNEIWFCSALISIVGALGTGAHGSSLKHPSSLSDQLKGVSFVDGKGFYRKLEASSKYLDSFKIHLGLLGVITDVTLETVPLFKMRGSRTLESDNILNDGTALQMAETYDFIQLAWFPFQRQVVAVKGEYLNNTSILGNDYVTLFTNVTRPTARSLKEAYDNMHEKRNIPGFHAVEENTILSLYQQVIGRVPIYTEDGQTLKNPAIGYGWRLLSGGCTECPWSHGINNSLYFDEASIGCPLEEFPKIVSTVKGILQQVPAGFPFSGIAFRFHEKSTATLSMSHAQKSVIVDMIYPNRIDERNKPKSGLAAYQAISQALVEIHGGRPHWGKNGLYYTTQKVLKKSVSTARWLAFRKAMHKYDPFGTFYNKFAKRFIGLSDKVDSDPQAVHCALRESCVCKRQNDCADDQTCSSMKDVNGVLSFNVCRDKKSYTSKPIGPHDPYNLTSVFEAIFS